MQITRELAYETWRRCGSMTIAANELGTTLTNMRNRLISYFKHNDLDTEEVQIYAQINTINKFCRYDYRNLRTMIGQECYYDGVAVYDIDGEIVFGKPGKYDEKYMIGVYDKRSDAEDARSDLYWYVTTQLETNNEHL